MELGFQRFSLSPPPEKTFCEFLPLSPDTYAHNLTFKKKIYSHVAPASLIPYAHYYAHKSHILNFYFFIRLPLVIFFCFFFTWYYNTPVCTWTPLIHLVNYARVQCYDDLCVRLLFSENIIYYYNIYMYMCCEVYTSWPYTEIRITP